MSEYNKLDVVSVNTINSTCGSLTVGDGTCGDKLLSSAGDTTPLFNGTPMGVYNPDQWQQVYWYEEKPHDDYYDLVKKDWYYDLVKKDWENIFKSVKPVVPVKAELIKENDLTKYIVAYNVLVLDDKEETGSKDRVILNLAGTIIGTGRWDDDQPKIVLKRSSEINEALKVYNDKNKCELAIEDLKIVNVWSVSTPLVSKKKD